ncbi:MAG: LysR family transcriptional regulator [Alphaproteobacteria bacterium]|nr:LysR family transcriptional regulator [Alphaproteobacteria bacterium]
MNLRDIEYIVAVAKLRHFAKAAEQCHVSQSTLSIQIKKLEEYLGVSLFERNNKHVMLTPIGQDIYEVGKRLLSEAQTIRNLAKQAKDPFSGTLKLGAFPTLAPYLFPQIAPLITKQLPPLDLYLLEEKTDQLLAQLQEGTVDCVLLALPVNHLLFLEVPLFFEPFFIALPKQHPLARKKQLSLEDISQEELLLLDEGHCLRSQSLELCTRIGKGESRHYRGTSLETLRSMVAAGAGITVIPQCAVPEKDAHLHYIPFSQKDIGRTIGLVYRKTSHRTALFEKISKIILDSNG